MPDCPHTSSSGCCSFKQPGITGITTSQGHTLSSNAHRCDCTVLAGGCSATGGAWCTLNWHHLEPGQRRQKACNCAVEVAPAQRGVLWSSGPHVQGAEVDWGRCDKLFCQRGTVCVQQLDLHASIALCAWPRLPLNSHQAVVYVLDVNASTSNVSMYCFPPMRKI